MLASAATTASECRGELALKLKRTEIQHEPSSIPGREIVEVLTELAYHGQCRSTVTPS